LNGQKVVSFFVASHAKQSGEILSLFKKSTQIGKMEDVRTRA
jgi:hypothetical protein